jgi:hypothetical protein
MKLILEKSPSSVWFGELLTGQFFLMDKYSTTLCMKVGSDSFSEVAGLGKNPPKGTRKDVRVCQVEILEVKYRFVE